MITTDSPRIYVACLASYNAGILHGRWIDAEYGADSITEDVQEMLAESPEPDAEEWAIHDYEGFGGIHLDESESFETVAELAELIAEHGEAYAAYVGHVGAEHATAQDFEESYRGEWDSERAYAETMFDALYLHDVPDFLQNYIDYEAYARDVFCGDFCSVDSSCGVYVFENC